jgi:hypothetical protein
MASDPLEGWLNQRERKKDPLWWKEDEVEPGNIDLVGRPNVPGPDGKRSSVLSGSYNIDGVEVLIPHVSTGPRARVLSSEEALELYKKTGQHLGKFKTPEAASAAGEAIHQDQVKMGPPGSSQRQEWMSAIMENAFRLGKYR